MKSIIKTFFILIFLVVIGGGFYTYNLLFTPASSDIKAISFKVTTGDSVKDVSTRLRSAGLIKSQLVFEYYARFSGLQSRLIVGEHEFKGNLNAVDILHALTASDNINKGTKITLIEGWTASQIGDYLERLELVNKKDFMSAISTDNWRDKYDFLTGVKAKTLEGFLFPDTYLISKKPTAEEIIKKCLDNFSQKVTAKMLSDIKDQNKDLLSILTMASVVEREAKTEIDKGMVADVFWKRVAKKMPLQSDATVNYITGHSDLRPSSADLQNDSLYNTYKYAGLPPGPIANPGLIAIKTTIYPTRNDYYFFITAKDGHTVYSKTFEEHQANINKYLN
ncbi:MAG: endolytic transglycosylase MltG [bacterium]